MRDNVEDLAVSVIIPVWNDPQRLRLCLEALDMQTLERDRFEVIVADNGSTDNTVEVARSFPGVKIVIEPQKGSYAARNSGAREARGKVIAFTDADCIPSPQWLENGLKYLAENPDTGVLAGEVTLFAPATGARRVCVNYEKMFELRQRSNVERWGMAVTANIMCSREVFTNLGGFDQKLLSTGDAEFTRRAVAGGHALIYVEGVEVRHPIRGALKEVVSKHVRVQGGVWDRWLPTPKLMTLYVFAARCAAGRSLKAIYSQEFSFLEKVELLAFINFLFAASLYEYTRRSLGFAARRR
ncbi:glycosyltransferase family 2 protein [Limibaculum sp. FT325]|uniref:glycosyltransferase n=1 Tax=Thermohalobaculum sediminis TaxID=2939436 RepID=UPI0020BE05CE|nr:glycosyltransferase family A protein [Limibaculum sediminis]MCL5777889.1 glycosyltransferase family 2 protein [Limibaculum sediminis]